MNAAPKQVSKPLTAGTLLENRYLLQEILGEGGFATVYLGRQLNIDRPVAIKILNLIDDPEAQKLIEGKFLLEARSAAEINHPNVVNIFDYGISEATRQPYIVMELLHGHTIEDELRMRGPMKAKRLFDLLIPCLDAMARAHRLNIIHRDLKPGNLFIADNGDGQEILKVLDFGVARAKAVQVRSTTANGQLMGTPRYLAPEYIDERIATTALDVYQLGLVIIEALTGYPVVPTNDPMESLWMHSRGELNVPVNLIRSELGPVLLTALEGDHHQRYGDAGALRDALEGLDYDALPEPGRKLVSLARARFDPEFEIDEDLIPPHAQTLENIEALRTPLFGTSISSSPTMQIDPNNPPEATLKQDPRQVQLYVNMDLAVPGGMTPNADPIDVGPTTEWDASMLEKYGLRPPEPNPPTDIVSLSPSSLDALDEQMQNKVVTFPKNRAAAPSAKPSAPPPISSAIRRAIDKRIAQNQSPEPARQPPTDAPKERRKAARKTRRPSKRAPAPASPQWQDRTATITHAAHTPPTTPGEPVWLPTPMTIAIAILVLGLLVVTFLIIYVLMTMAPNL